MESTGRQRENFINRNLDMAGLFYIKETNPFYEVCFTCFFHLINLSPFLVKKEIFIKEKHRIFPDIMSLLGVCFRICVPHDVT